MEYRREIDGLRAIAVLPVMFFHAGLPGFSGGYVGVDVFFVISGFLITSIILGEIAQNDFSLQRFYERRIRRIFPAFIFVLCVSLLFGTFWLSTSDLYRFALTAAFASAFISNFRFYRDNDYFAPEAEVQPLIHTWSLGIEEQFYLLFPLLVMLLTRWRKSLILPVLLFIAAASLILAQHRLSTDASAAFFLTQYRIWELLLGAIVASLISSGRLRVTASQTGSFLALAFIVLPVIFYNAQTPFPGVSALAPTLGAAGVILFATPQTIVGRILALPVLVSVGLISYSAYLWHQPVFAFARIRFAIDDNLPVMFLLCLLALGFAYLTWRFIEQPFRIKSGFRVLLQRPTALFCAAAISVAAFGLLGQVISRISFDAIRGQDKAEIDRLFVGTRGLDRKCGAGDLSNPVCRTSDNPDVAVWGDSFAMHLVPGILASNPDVRLIQLTKGACPPILGLAPIDHRRSLAWSKQCLAHNKRVVELLFSQPAVKTVAIGTPIFTMYGPGIRVLDEMGIVQPGDERVLATFLKTLAMIRDKGIEPVIFAPPPVPARNIGRCLASAMMFHRSLENCNFNLADAETHRKQQMSFIAAVAAQGFRIVSFSAEICRTGVCVPFASGVPLYGDAAGHLTSAGSALLGKRMQFDRLLKHP